MPRCPSNQSEKLQSTLNNPVDGPYVIVFDKTLTVWNQNKIVSLFTFVSYWLMLRILLKKHIKIVGQDENRGLYLAIVCAMKTIRANKDAFSWTNTWKPEKDFLLVAYYRIFFPYYKGKKNDPISIT